MPNATFYPGGRAYGTKTFTRATGETDATTGTTATVTLIDPEGTETSVTPTVSTPTTSTVLVVWEYTLPTNAVPGMWTEDIQTASVLIAREQRQFRVLRPAA